MQRKERLFLIYSKVPVGFLVLLGKASRLSSMTPWKTLPPHTPPSFSLSKQ